MSRNFKTHKEIHNANVSTSIDTPIYLSQKYNFDIRLFFDGYEELMKEEKEIVNN